jgi:hypothetical protein
MCNSAACAQTAVCTILVVLGCKSSTQLHGCQVCQGAAATYLAFCMLEGRLTRRCSNMIMIMIMHTTTCMSHCCPAPLTPAPSACPSCPAGQLHTAYLPAPHSCTQPTCQHHSAAHSTGRRST